MSLTSQKHCSATVSFADEGKRSIMKLRDGHKFTELSGWAGMGIEAGVWIQSTGA